MDKDVVVLSKSDLIKQGITTKLESRKYLDKEFINYKISALPMGQKRMLLTYLWMSGVRVTEAVNLVKNQIDFNKSMMTVKWLKSRKYKERVVPIHSRLLPLLQIYTSSFKAEAKVFPITRQRVYQITQEVLGCSPHQLRHSFAVNWLRGKGNIVVLHRILGHARLQTTMEYLKIVPMDQLEELEKINFWST